MNRLHLCATGMALLAASFSAAAQESPVSPPPAPPAMAPAPVYPPPPPSRAEAPPPALGAGNQDLRGLIEEVMTARLARRLGLNDEQTVLLVRRLTDYKERLRKSRRERQNLVGALRGALQNAEPEAQVQQKLEALMAHDAEAEKLRRNAYETAASDLSTVQRAKLYVFLGEFEADMRRLVQKARERATGPLRGRPGDQAPPAASGPPPQWLRRQGMMERPGWPPPAVEAPAPPPPPPAPPLQE